jgi:GNAT superfamily N-acetyltransferase
MFSKKYLLFVLYLFVGLINVGKAAHRVDCNSLEGLSFWTVNAAELAVDSSFWKIYAESFPENEQVKPERLMSNLAATPSEFVMRLVDDKSSNTVGLALVNLFEKTSVSFLGYLAIDKDARGKSLGSELFKCALFESKERFARAGSKFQGMVWEVEKPELADSLEDKTTRERRIAFYNRLGATILTNDYEMKSVGSGHEDLNMALMIMSEEGSGDQSRTQQKEFINHVIEAIWSLAATEAVN